MNILLYFNFFFCITELSLFFSSELTQTSNVVEVIQKEDLLKSLRSLRELQPWKAPLLLAHLHRSPSAFIFFINANTDKRH